MTQEDKELLLQDLCARLPYGVILNTPNGNKSLLALVKSKKYNTIIEYDDYCGNENDTSEWKGGDVEFVKPYLRPMSSMTKEEKEEYDSKRKHICDEYNRYCFDTVESIDWLNAHHFDYRGLIEKGLALEALEGMYNTNNE